jgi:hypothetical protein
MTFGTKVSLYLGIGRTRLKTITASATSRNFAVIFGVNVFFHSHYKKRKNRSKGFVALIIRLFFDKFRIS